MLTDTFLVWFLTVERVFKGEVEDSPYFDLVVALGIGNRFAAGAINLYL